MPVIQRMSKVQVLPLGNYASGSRTLGPVDIADDVNSIDIDIDCCTSTNPTIWPNVSTVLTITPQVSLDGGITWIEAGKSVTNGGIHIGKNGVELTSIPSGGSIPAPINGVMRKYQVGIDIAGGPLRTSANVDVN